MQNYANMKSLSPGFGGFGCSRNALIAVNVLYICVAVILIGVAGYGIAGSEISPFGVIIAIVTISVFLLLIAVVGIAAAILHHQVALFFYMVILFILFVLQFSVACACLAVGPENIKNLMEHGYTIASNDTKGQVQQYYGCCGFEGPSVNITGPLADHPSCSGLPCCGQTASDSATECSACSGCFGKMEAVVKASLRLCGGIGLFFSFTELFGIFITVRYRNQRNPYINPADLL